jgi:hypothetical protein
VINKPGVDPYSRFRPLQRASERETGERERERERGEMTERARAHARAREEGEGERPGVDIPLALGELVSGEFTQLVLAVSARTRRESNRGRAT